MFKKWRKENVSLANMKTVETPPNHDLWSRLLHRNVTPEGRVLYAGFARERDSLRLYLETLSQNPPDPDRWPENEQLAYWINAYNAFTVELILTHYPVKSIKDIAGKIPMINSPWDLKFFKIGGVDFDLNTIEHEILRKQFQEPRIHFAINCASKSCPNLLNEAYLADRLEAQLQRQAIRFVNDSTKNQIAGDEARLSPIFNWFAKDFTQNGTLTDFINRFAKQPLSPKTKIRFLGYDWNLNE
ncbi:MAG: DUF547 domain-containing protein [Bacteroidetes bacterium]|nr:MAG: DUF547 domain-containing protein [Bacteroidota bacterium]